MPTPYDVRCHECNESLEVTSRSMDSDGDVMVIVRPCPECLAAARLDAEANAE